MYNWQYHKRLTHLSHVLSIFSVISYYFNICMFNIIVITVAIHHSVIPTRMYLFLWNITSSCILSRFHICWHNSFRQWHCTSNCIIRRGYERVRFNIWGRWSRRIFLLCVDYFIVGCSIFNAIIELYWITKTACGSLCSVDNCPLAEKMK